MYKLYVIYLELPLYEYRLGSHSLQKKKGKKVNILDSTGIQIPIFQLFRLWLEREIGRSNQQDHSAWFWQLILHPSSYYTRRSFILELAFPKIKTKNLNLKSFNYWDQYNYLPAHWFLPSSNTWSNSPAYDMSIGIHVKRVYPY